VSREATVELLSRYLDGDLSAAEHQRVDAWIEADEKVREIYDGLSRVRGSLARLADAAPPSHLDVTVQRRVALEIERTGLWSQVDRGLRWALAPATLPVFAVILALAAMLYVLANGLARFERPREPLFLPAPPGTVAAPESLEVAGRVLTLRRDRWVESGLEPAEIEAARRVEVGAAERPEWIGRRPELAPAAELGTVLLRLDGEVVELVFEPVAP
jgi:anti-sigma factor RsiW